MIYKKLGQSGLKVSILSYGSWISFHEQKQDETADELMSYAYDNGVNFFDNAEVYALGESEKMMGRVLKSKNWERSSYIVSSKVFFGWRGENNKPNQTGLSRKHIIEACDEALQRLQVDYLDLYFCHRYDKDTPVSEIVWSMNELIQRGKILYWGTSMWEKQELQQAFEFAEKYGLVPPTMEQPEYNLFNRQKMDVEYKKIFKKYGLGTTIWSPLASGFLTGKYLKTTPINSRLSLKDYAWIKEKYTQKGIQAKVEKYKNFCQKNNVDTAQFAIAWCLKNPNVSTVILGATKKEQLKNNLNALKLTDTITPKMMKEVDNIFGYSYSKGREGKKK